jgi:hypothetical protein
MIKLKMSLNQTVTKAVNEIINSFVKKIATKYDLDQNELLCLWNDSDTSGKKVIKSTDKKIVDTPIVDKNTNNDLNQIDLSQYKKTDLQDMCRQRSLKCTGTKEQLIGFLLGKEIISDTPKKEAPAKKTEVSKKVTSTPVAQKLTSSIPTVAIRRNKYGNHEHPDTKFIFDKKTTKAIGKQNEDGTIEDLTEDDIDVCNQWKFQYVISDNLDKKTKLTDVKVDELDDEILESDDDEIEDEEIPVEEEIVEDELLEDDEEYEEEDEYEDDDVDYE